MSDCITVARLIEWIPPIVLICGTLTIVSVCINVIVWALRGTIRNYIEAKYATRVKYIIQDVAQNMVDNREHIKQIEETLKRMEKKEQHDDADTEDSEIPK